MRTVLILTLMIFLPVFSDTAENVEKPSQRRENIAIIDMDARAVSENEALSITDELRTQVHKTRKFKVIERNRMQEILKEQGFQQSGACTSNECMVEMGQLIGVEKIITGSIGKVGTLFILSVRLIDVGTGEIIKDVTEKHKGAVEDLVLTAVQSIAEKLAGNPGAVKTKTAESKGGGIKKWSAFLVSAAAGGAAFYFNTSADKYYQEYNDLNYGDNFKAKKDEIKSAENMRNISIGICVTALFPAVYLSLRE
ncbi:MAG: CsgG/HfaB family protein [Fibrobacterota bacterium]